ncbi:acyl-CoA dehydrogenase family protein [Streptomyces aidingensis]|uniref:Acyl-CoA dehydrogenase, C-terminal domain n=1 Tax=Streptomyces aidingensis TaxID=910347 RepID=A0A1I1N494_9ACTN|nr:acyl-CoA dehydrogenase family protein [Streptomyces aidingensis]SFC88620.1 Acyl-CoA dehydrogenase, C-terminal domain [Streptomyces aidingensis]
MRETLAECERAGHRDGLAAGLGPALDGAGADAAPGSVAALPSAAVPPRASLVPHPLAAREGVSFVRRPARHRTAAPERLTALAARLAAVRLGLTRRLAERAVDHLSGRIGGGEPLIRRQLVLGTLADARVELEVARRTLRVAGTLPAAVAEVHDRLTELDWELAKLLGGSGYAGDGALRGVVVSRLVANCWVAREATGEAVP